MTVIHGVRVRGARVAKLPSHHITNLDHQVKSDAKFRLSHHVSNLPAHPTVLTFEKRKGSDFLRVTTGRRLKKGEKLPKHDGVRKFLEGVG